VPTFACAASCADAVAIHITQEKQNKDHFYTRLSRSMKQTNNHLPAIGSGANESITIICSTSDFSPKKKKTIDAETFEN
jgi:hypothetical protein